MPPARPSGLLSLNYAGLTSTGSSNPDGSAIANGTAFTINTIFSDVPSIIIQTGDAKYQPTAIDFIVGASSYSVTAGSLSNYAVQLIHYSGDAYPYIAALWMYNNSGNLSPAYQTANPSLSATSPSPTVFSSYPLN